MSLKMDFVERAGVPGAKIAPLCREFGISRQTGHKWLTRFRSEGYAGLEERSRRPRSSPQSLTEELVVAILDTRDAHPTWGPRKLTGLLARRYGDNAPSAATVARVLRRFGRIERRGRRALGVAVLCRPQIPIHDPNDLWTIDFKGWWRTLDNHRCEPLTIRDACSRFILFSRLLKDTSGASVRDEMTTLFEKYGLPKAIQCDNGSPFINVRARGGLSRLSAWWVSLGIELVRSRPGCPQDNGAHERMHRDLSCDVEASPSDTRASAQRALDHWRQEFNHVRPHDALDGKVPADLYRRSQRKLGRIRPPSYPSCSMVRRLGACGTFRLQGERYFVSHALAGHQVGLERADGLKWRVWFHNIDLGIVELAPDIDGVMHDWLDAGRIKKPKNEERPTHATVNGKP